MRNGLLYTLYHSITIFMMNEIIKMIFIELNNYIQNCLSSSIPFSFLVCTSSSSILISHSCLLIVYFTVYHTSSNFALSSRFHTLGGRARDTRGPGFMTRTYRHRQIYAGLINGFKGCQTHR